MAAQSWYPSAGARYDVDVLDAVARAGGGARPSAPSSSPPGARAGNAAVLARESREVARLFEATYAAGTLPVAQLRGRLRQLGVVETAAAQRLLAPPSVSLAALRAALSAGGDAPGGGAGAPAAGARSSPAVSVFNTALAGDVDARVWGMGKARESARDEPSPAGGRGGARGAAVAGGQFRQSPEFERAFGDHGEEDRAAARAGGGGARPLSEHRSKMPDRATRRDGGAGALLGAFDDAAAAAAAAGSPGAGGALSEHRSKAREVRRDAQAESGVGALLAGGAPAREGLGAISGRALHPAKVAGVWAESAPDSRADILPVGVAARAAAAGVDPRSLVQRVALHESRRARAAAPWATTD